MRRGIMITAAAGLTLALAACQGGGSDDPTPTPTGGEETSAEASGSLTIWADELRANALTDVVAQFEADNGVTVEVVQKNFEDIKTEFLAQAPTGEGPDIIIGANDWAGELATNGVIAPVDLGDTASQFQQIALDAFNYDGQNFGLPYAIENIALVVNTGLTDAQPTTWDELVSAGEESGADFPLLVQMGETGDAYHMYPFQTSFGAPVFASDDSGSYTSELALGGENGEAFAQWLADNGSGGSGVLDTAITGDIAKEQFVAGASPFMVTGPWNIPDFTAAGIDVAVLPVPSAGGETAAPFVGVQGFYVNAMSENALLANNFLVNYVATEDVQVALYEAGGRTPALQAAADSVSADDPVAAGFAEAGAVGAPLPNIPEMNSVWTFLGQTEADLVSGDAGDPADAWDTMVTNIQDAIGG